MDWHQRLVLIGLVHRHISRGIIYLLALYYVYQQLEMNRRRNRIRGPARRYSMISRIPMQSSRLFRLFTANDVNCKDILRMDRNCFLRLCYLLEHNGGLTDGRNVTLKEQVAIFLSILAHHLKNRKVQFDYYRSGETISKYFNIVLRGIIRLHRQMLVKPTPPTTALDDGRWLPFEDSLGALDGTHIDVQVRLLDRPRYRDRKGNISVNVLAACDRNINFIYVLTGWEGSASDSRVLKDAIHRNNSKFQIPRGNYYLCDNGYTNGFGFLVPYRGVRYHLKEWGVGRELPQNYKEYFNMKHAQARNVIERAFGILKQRWAILRSKAYHPIESQNHVILVCCLLHNFIRLNMSRDPLEDFVVPDPNENLVNDEQPDDYIDVVEPSEEWATFREELAQNMYNAWLASRGL